MPEIQVSPDTRRIRFRQPALSSTLERIRIEKEFSRPDWLDRLSVTEGEYSLFLQSGSGLSRKNLDPFCFDLGITHENLISGNIDFRSLSRGNGRIEMPEQYRTGAFSTRRAVISFLDGLESIFDWRWRHSSLKHFGLSEDMLGDATKPTSIRLIEDLAKHAVSTYGLSQHSLFELGSYSMVAHHDCPAGQEFAKARTVSEIYERLFGDLLHYFENNSSFTLVKVKPDLCHVEVRSRPDVATALGVHRIGSREVCQVRAGILASLTGYLGLPFADVHELECMHLGNQRCLIEIDLTRAHRRWLHKDAS